MANVQISELSDLSSPAWADLLPADKADGLSTGKIPFSTLAYLALANWKWKSPVVAVASSNISIASGLENGDTVDSVTLVTGNRVLLTAQTTTTENGIYVVPASGAASRATDMDSSSEFIGAVVSKSSTGDVYVCTAKPDFTLGTDTPSFVLCSSTTGQQRTFMGMGTAATLASDTDTSLAANSDSRIATQKAVKAYVDAVSSALNSAIAGLSWKQPVDVLMTANVDLAPIDETTDIDEGQTVDEITLVAGMRVALVGQTAGAENGIYICPTAGSGTALRASDANSSAEMKNCAFFVARGTTYQDKAYVCTTDNITLGTTSLTFVSFASTVGALIASNNLSDVASAATSRTNLGLGTSDSVTHSRVLVANGTVGAPGFSFSSFTDLGILPANSVDLGFAANSQWIGVIGTTYGGFCVQSDFQIGWSSSASDASAGMDTGLSRAATKVVGFTDGSTTGGTYSSTPRSVTITANQNNYAVSGSMFIDIDSADGNYNFTGFAAGVNGQMLYLTNNTTNRTFTIVHNSGSSSAGNKVYCLGTANLTLSPGRVIRLVYKSSLFSAAGGWHAVVDGVGPSESFTGTLSSGAFTCSTSLSCTGSSFSLNSNAFVILSLGSVALFGSTSPSSVINFGLNSSNGNTIINASYQLAWDSSGGSYSSSDIGLKRNAAGVLQVTDGSTGWGVLRASQSTTTTGASMSGTETLVLNTHNNVIVERNPNGANREIDLWSSPAAGQNVRIVHTGTQYTLTVKDTSGGSTLAVLAPGDTFLFVYDGSAWKTFFASALNWRSPKTVTVTASQDNYDFFGAINLDITSADGDYNFTGFLAGVNGQTFYVANHTSQTFTLKHNSGSSSAGNKIYGVGAADVVLGPGEEAVLTYKTHLFSAAGAWYAR